MVAGGVNNNIINLSLTLPQNEHTVSETKANKDNRMIKINAVKEKTLAYLVEYRCVTDIYVGCCFDGYWLKGRLISGNEYELIAERGGVRMFKTLDSLRSLLEKIGFDKFDFKGYVAPKIGYGFDGNPKADVLKGTLLTYEFRLAPAPLVKG